MQTKFLATALILLTFISTVGAGTYTVSFDGADAEYSLAEAQAYANSNLEEQITFELASGNYGEVSFTDSTNRLGWDKGVTFKPGPRENPVFGKLSFNRHVNRYMTFEGITVSAPDGSDYSSAYDGTISIRKSSHIKILNCTVTGQWREDRVQGSWLTHNGIIIRDDVRGGPGQSDVLIQGCDVSKAYFGIRANGNLKDGIILRNNAIHQIASTYLEAASYGLNSEILVENNHMYNRLKTNNGPPPKDGSHGAGVYFGAHNVTIRGNIIRDYGGSGGIAGFGTYVPEGGYKDILIENNLVYDPQGTTMIKFDAISENVTIRNNTFVGFTLKYPAGVHRYGTVAKFWPYGDKGARNVFIYNNVFVGYVWIDEDLGDFTENNNIFWALTLDGDNPESTPPGPDSIIVRTGTGFNSDYKGDYFEGSGNFFAGGPAFDQYSYTRPLSDDPVLIYYGTGDVYSSHKQNLNTDYKLASGSEAIGFANLATASKTDLEGNPRDENPDAGAYEFAPACQTKSECQDNYQCKTLVSCTNQQCVYGNKTGSCNDGDACTLNDACSSGRCEGTQKNCDDEKACTTDTCSEGTCFNTPNHSACGESTTCTTYTCTGTGCQTTYNTGTTCNDGIFCTEGDSCDATGNCKPKTTQDSLCPDYDGCIGKTCTTTGCVYTPTGCNIPPDLLLWLKLDSDVQDYSTYSNNGTFQGGTPNYVQGKVGQSLEFDGSSNLVDVGNIQATEQLTVTAWVYRNDSGDDRIVCKATGTAVADHIFCLGLYSNNRARVRINTGTASSFDATTAINTGEWAHLAFTYNGQQLKIYTNGQQTGSFAKTGNIKTSNQTVTIGNVNTTSSRYFNGKIDEARIYNRALTSQEILALYNQAEQQCVDTPALLNHISSWKQGNLGMLSLMQKLGLWKAGTGC